MSAHLRTLLAAFALGLLLGPASWWIVRLATDRFEPFDNSAGFFLCQAVLALPMAVLAFRRGMIAALPALPGAWIGMNAYAYAFGSGETRAWIVLLLFSSLTLLMFPLAATVAGGIGHALRRRMARRGAAGDGMRSSPATQTNPHDAWAGRPDTSND